MSKRKANKKAKQSIKATKQQVPVKGNTATLKYIGIIAAILGGLLYLNTLGHDYTLDDFSVIKDNWLTQKGLAGIPTIFETEYRYGAWNSPGSLYRPLTSSMFALEWQLSPDNPFLGHLLNVLLYALTGFLLWRTWRYVLKDYSPWLPAMGVLFFMTHPIHTEVVANIKSRDEILSLIFVTLALHTLFRHFDTKKIGYLISSVLLYGVALFSKESSITFLAIFPLVTWFFKENAREKLSKTAFYLIPAGIYLAVRNSILSAQSGQESYSILDNFIVGAENYASQLASAVMMCGVYLSKLIFPLTLVSDKGYPQMAPVTFADFGAIFGLLMYGVMLIWSIRNLKNKHFLSFAFLFYLITFSLFSNVFYTIGTSYGERVLYLPSLGFCFAIAWLIWHFIGKKVAAGGKVPSAMFGSAAAILLLYSARTLTRNPDWENSFTLYTADRPNSPNCAKLNYHAGLEEAKRGLDDSGEKVIDKASLQKAVQSYSKAMELYPKYHDAYGARGLAHFRMGDYQKAEMDYLEALKYRPNDAKVLSNMGFIYMNVKKDIPKAEEVYRKAIKYDPRFVDAQRNLGAVLALTKRYDEAITHFQKGLEIEPDNATLWLYMGYAHRDKGDAVNGQKYLEKAYGFNPNLRPK